MKRFSLGNTAIYISASIIPCMFFVGSAVGQIYKHYNTANVDIHHGLAYLREILLFSFTAGLITMIVGFYLSLRSLGSAERDKGVIALKLIVIQIVLFVILGIIRTIYPTT